MGHWNHRVLVHESKEELWFIIHEVHYDDDGKPCGYTENGTPVMGESVGELQGVLTWMQECLEKPALWAGDKFPMEYDKG